MSSFPENGVAPVEPRAQKPEGDALPLTELVTEILFDGAKTVRLTGEGKSTAMEHLKTCLLYTSPSPRDQRGSRMPSSA